MDDVFIKMQTTTVYGKLLGEPTAPLVLGIHGWSQREGWRTWEPLMAPLAAAGYCVVCIDMPGWGDSPAMDALPLGGERAAQVVVDVMNGLMKTSAVLMGKSWGGGVALETALAFPERVQKLVLSAPVIRQTDRLTNLAQPVLLVWAEDDAVVDVTSAEILQSFLPTTQTVIYPTGGHSAAPNNASQFAPTLIDFLN